MLQIVHPVTTYYLIQLAPYVVGILLGIFIPFLKFDRKNVGRFLVMLVISYVGLILFSVVSYEPDYYDKLGLNGNLTLLVFVSVVISLVLVFQGVGGYIIGSFLRWFINKKKLKIKR